MKKQLTINYCNVTYETLDEWRVQIALPLHQQNSATNAESCSYMKSYREWTVAL